MNNIATEKERKTVLNRISIPDLVACLKLFYDGELDVIPDDILPRLYLSLNQLDPTNSLFGQLSSAELGAALSKIDRKFTDALEFLNTKRESLRPILESDYVKVDTAPFDFDEFVMLRSKYCLYRLTDLLRQVL